MEYVTKTSVVKRAINTMDFKTALRIAKGFRIGNTKLQQDKMTRAYECMVHPDFYKSIGIDVDEAIKQGIQVVTALYG